ncbi:hypothetical protein Taro_041213 [Colocasia esculenta]|uniref:Small auxin up regulated protein n=1 Tax=Colocasia esculenta TaxID=4460 RepID=A0A843WDS0_COLES|nr:hypothetical protein [Colocasia esculenta]
MGKHKKEQEAAPKGYVPMLVGREGAAERLLVRAELLNHPAVAGLLEMAAQEFGYRQHGVLRIPCDVEAFHRVVKVAAAGKTGVR